MGCNSPTFTTQNITPNIHFDVSVIHVHVDKDTMLAFAVIYQIEDGFPVL